MSFDPKNPLKCCNGGHTCDGRATTIVNDIRGKTLHHWCDPCVVNRRRTDLDVEGRLLKTLGPINEDAFVLIAWRRRHIGV